MWQAWINIFAGAWVFISAFLPKANIPGNYFIMGIIITVFGFWTPRNQWQGIINGIIGLWLVLSGLIPGLHLQVNLGVSGIIVVILAAWRVYSISHAKPVHA